MVCALRMACDILCNLSIAIILQVNPLPHNDDFDTPEEKPFFKTSWKKAEIAGT